MFEKFGFDGMRVEVQAMLTLYAQGLLTGLVLDSGDGVTHAVAVFDGFCMPHLTRRLDVAGRHVTRYLIKLMLMRGYTFNRTADFQTAQEMKEKLCYVALDPPRERNLALETTVLMEDYTLPDGRVVRMGSERCVRGGVRVYYSIGRRPNCGSRECDSTSTAISVCLVWHIIKFCVSPALHTSY